MTYLHVHGFMIVIIINSLNSNYKNKDRNILLLLSTIV